MARKLIVPSFFALSVGLLACDPAKSPSQAGAASDEPSVSTSPALSEVASDTIDSAAPDTSVTDRPRVRQAMTPTAMQQRSERGFDRLDANGDDVVTMAELESGAEDGGRGTRMLERADANDDGRITRAEVRAMAAERFARMDADGDGVISDEERPQRGDRRGPPDEP